MSRFKSPDPFSSRPAKLVITLVILAINIAFYFWGDADGWTGAQAAYEVSPFFGAFLSLIGAGAFGSYVYFTIKNV